MSKNNKIEMKLQAEAVFDVPLHCYENDFTFIVNGEEFRTNRFFSDLLSPKIGQQHLIDPTINTFTINTTSKGHFSYILKLVDFKSENPPETELQFINEVLEILENKTVNIVLPQISETITIDNVFTLIEQHSKNAYFYSSYYSKEIEFLSHHFCEMKESEEEKISNLDIDTIELILSNEKLLLRDENQLLSLINRLYMKSHEFSKLYEKVQFSFVDEAKIQEFVDIFDVCDITNEIWHNLSSRLTKKIYNQRDKENELKQNRYFKEEVKFKEFLYENNNEFDGIFNHLRNKSNGYIQSLVEITSSPLHHSSLSQYNVCLYEKQDEYFHSTNESNSWICFDFKKHRIIPTSYIIKSSPYNQNGHHPRSWIIEGSNDNSTWETIDEVNNCPYLNGQYFVHSFNITKNISKEFRYIRMRQTSSNWYPYIINYYFTLGSIEFYGKLF